MARINIAEGVLQVATENFKAAELRIRDADIAQEAGDLVRTQILQQVLQCLRRLISSRLAPALVGDGSFIWISLSK